VKAASDIYSPIAGRETAINESLAAKPEKVNSAPYDAWLFRLAPAAGADRSLLVDAATYRAMVEAAA